MFKSSTDSIFLFFRTLRYFLIFFLRDIIMLSNINTTFALDLGNT